MRVPRWRTMMAPACTWPPSNTFTPRRCAWESRPFLVDPPPFVLLIGDPRDLDRVVVLAVAPPVALLHARLLAAGADDCVHSPVRLPDADLAPIPPAALAAVGGLFGWRRRKGGERGGLRPTSERR